MKKILISFMLVISILLAMCACQQKDENQKDENLVNESNKSINLAINTEAMKKYGDLKKFKTTTLEGKEFSQENLKNYDLTIVNFWGTYCKPCVQELPELSKIKNSLPNNVNFIGICADSEGNEELAKEIIAKCKSRMTHLKCNDSINEAIANNIQYLPMTIIFDKDGNIVGEIISGAPMDVINEYSRVINNALKIIGKESIKLNYTENKNSEEKSEDTENTSSNSNENSIDNEESTNNDEDDCFT